MVIENNYNIISPAYIAGFIDGEAWLVIILDIVYLSVREKLVKLGRPGRPQL